MRFALMIFALGLLPGVVLAQATDPVFLEELTWTEVRDALAAGSTTVIIPTGGTEQNGPHMVLGKHNYLVRYKAGEVARRLGNALVAPVMAYVPEGDVDPPSGHMRFPGTITTPQRCSSRCWSSRPEASDSTASSTSRCSVTAGAIKRRRPLWLSDSTRSGRPRRSACIT